MENELKKYRQALIDTKIKLNESYDKLLITLSGGALALSITFLKDVIGTKDILYPSLLLTSWGLFIFSLASILGEILFGIQAHKKAIKQIDDNTIYKEKVGGKYSFFSIILHWAAAVSLLLGLIFISVFVYLNIGGKDVREETKSKTTTYSQATAAAITRPGTTRIK